MKTLQERFDEKYIPVTESGCWLWIGASFFQRHFESSAYGQMVVGGKYKKAHRVSYELHKGPIPEGKFVLHKCDTPCCVNPDHLYAGTQAENVKDRDNRGRRNAPKGELSAKAILKLNQVRRIRRLIQEGMPNRAIAKQYKVHPSTIYRIKVGDSWVGIQ